MIFKSIDFLISVTMNNVKIKINWLKFKISLKGRERGGGRWDWGEKSVGEIKFRQKKAELNSKEKISYSVLHRYHTAGIQDFIMAALTISKWAAGMPSRLFSLSCMNSRFIAPKFLQTYCIIRKNSGVCYLNFRVRIPSFFLYFKGFLLEPGSASFIYRVPCLLTLTLSLDFNHLLSN
jgi:hypothetical protein